jgi:hypothetical protein
MKKIMEPAIYAAASVLAVSVFLPLTKLAIVGNVSYHDIASTEAYIVILLALSGPVFIFIRQSKFILASVAGVWLTLFFPWVKQFFSSNDSTLMGQLSGKSAEIMNDFAAELFLNITRYEWGGYLLLGSLLVFTAAGILRGLAKR